MPIKQEVAKEVDFEQLFDTDYPDQFDQFWGKGGDETEQNRGIYDMEMDVINIRKKAEKRYKDVKNVTNLVSLNFQS